MKKFMRIVCYLIFISTTFMYSQNSQEKQVSVEKNLMGVQLGIINVLNFQDEFKVARKVALRGEIGFNLGLYVTSDKTYYLIAPGFNLEPRWYYGLDRRSRLGKNTSHNSSNYVSIKTLYQTDWVVSGTDKTYITPYIGVIPTYGIRRSFAKNFNYEFNFGLGVISDTKETSNVDRTRATIDIGARIGYNF